MVLFLLSLLLFGLTAAICFLLGGFSLRVSRLWVTTLGLVGNISASIIGLVAAAQILFGGEIIDLRFRWQMPVGEIRLMVDSLSSFFLLTLYLLTIAAAIYSVEYFKDEQSTKKLALFWGAFSLLCGSMALVFAAYHGLFFLLAWELTVFASFFLVLYEHEEEKVRRAAWIYFLASHLGTSFLIIAFLLAARDTGSLDFNSFAALSSSAPQLCGAIFFLSVLGFGTKAGLVPFHVWLPEAHPSAPSQVSALMSGIMIKMGIYGIFRMIFLLGEAASAWWAWLLLLLAICSGLFGILNALAQRDLKRMLAYCSVENVGIISLGLGLGLLGFIFNTPKAAMFGFTGALLHVMTHAFNKACLFLSGGFSVKTAATRDLEKLGGLLKHQPFSAFSFLLGSISIAGIPPLAGFISELLIYFGAFSSIIEGPTQVRAASIVIICSLAAIGGFSAFCFTKSFGLVYLGHKRSECLAKVADMGKCCRTALILLLALIIGIPLLSKLLVGLTFGIIFQQPLFDKVFICWKMLIPLLSALDAFLLGSTCLMVIIILLVILRSHLQRSQSLASGVTWDCGYAAPHASMQYSASSYSQPAAELSARLMGVRSQLTWYKSRAGFLFPSDAAFTEHLMDGAYRRFYAPLFSNTHRLLGYLNVFQQGITQSYVVYIAISLIVLLIVGSF